MNWDAELRDLPPIDLPDGRKLKTLADCRDHILKLPAEQQDQKQWQDATPTLLKAAEHGSVFMFIARIAVSRALRGVSGVEPAPEREDKQSSNHWKYRRKRPA